MYIEGTALLKKKVLTLDSIKQQIMNGQRLFIKDDQFNNTEIKTAVSLGLLKAIGLEEKDAPKKSTLKIKCVNVSKRPINLLVMNSDVSPGQEFHLTEDQIQDYAVRTSISSGLIQVRGAVDQNNTAISVSNIRLSSLLPEEVLTKAAEKVQLTENIAPQSHTKAIEETVKWNPSSGKPIRTSKAKTGGKKTTEEAKIDDRKLTVDPNGSMKKITDKQKRETIILQHDKKFEDQAPADGPVAFDPNNVLRKPNSKEVAMMVPSDENGTSSKGADTDDRVTVFDPNNDLKKCVPDDVVYVSAKKEVIAAKDLQQNGELNIGS